MLEAAVSLSIAALTGMSILTQRLHGRINELGQTHRQSRTACRFRLRDQGGVIRHYGANGVASDTD